MRCTRALTALLVAGARELAGPGTSRYAEAGVPRDLLGDALG